MPARRPPPSPVVGYVSRWTRRRSSTTSIQRCSHFLIEGWNRSWFGCIDRKVRNDVEQTTVSSYDHKRSRRRRSLIILFCPSLCVDLYTSACIDRYHRFDIMVYTAHSNAARFRIVTVLPKSRRSPPFLYVYVIYISTSYSYKNDSILLPNQHFLTHPQRAPPPPPSPPLPPPGQRRGQSPGFLLSIRPCSCWGASSARRAPGAARRGGRRGVRSLFVG